MEDKCPPNGSPKKPTLPSAAVSGCISTNPQSVVELQNHRLFNRQAELSKSSLAQSAAAPGSAVAINRFEILKLSVADIDLILSTIKQERRTGSLTIHFSQGRAGGYAEFKQQV